MITQDTGQALGVRHVHQYTSTFLAPGAGFVEDSFSYRPRGGVGIVSG